MSQLHLHKSDIMTRSSECFNSFTEVVSAVNDTLFFQPPAPGKWSIADHVNHLVQTNTNIAKAYNYPQFLLVWMAGRPATIARSYQESYNRYSRKLAQGAKATGKYLPKKTNELSKQAWITAWETANTKLLNGLKYNRTNFSLDDLQINHPVLGKITLRELSYFTIYHTQHHLDTIQQIINQLSHT